MLSFTILPFFDICEPWKVFFLNLVLKGRNYMHFVIFIPYQCTITTYPTKFCFANIRVCYLII
jgi:hypothetical protein